MAINNRKVTSAEVNTNHVQAAADRPTGTAAQNKEIFDKLPELIVERHNGLCDDVITELDGKVPKKSGADTYTYLYAHNGDGTEGNIKTTSIIGSEGQIPRLDAHKSFLIPKATTFGNDLYVANLRYVNEKVAEHSGNTSNPHSVTKAQVGLGNADNTSDADKPVSTAMATALAGKVDKVEGKGLSKNDYTDAEKSAVAGISGKADNNAVVHLANAETVTGKKTFSDDINVNGSKNVVLGSNKTNPQKIHYGENDRPALYVGNSYAGYLVTDSDIETELAGKVDKVSGKGLSSEDYSSAEKTKLGGIESGAQVNVITADAPSDSKTYGRKNGAWSEITGGGSTAWNDITGKPDTFPPSSHTHDDRYYTETETDTLLDEKADASDIPTKTSDLTNDSGFLTQHQSLAAYRTSAAQDVIDDAIEADIDAIEEKIPSQATSSNQLADKSFVNSSIGTNTAYYISNNGEPFASVAQLQAYSGTVTNNDYAFVTGIDAQGNTYFDRYKATVVGTVVSWAKEYRLNNSSFTAAQWAAISSGITSGKVATYDGYAAQIAAKYTKPASGIPESDLASGVQTTLSNSASHIANRQNPHSVTKAQVGLGNVRNIALFMNTQPTHVPDEEVLAYIVDNTEGVKYTIPQGTYSIPSGGIPSTDMTSAVQTSLGKADTALQSVPATYRTAAAQDVIDGGKEVLSNKVTSISSASTDTQYPTAKCLYDMCGNIETLLAAI